jgi:hypothetical protein
MADKSNWEEFPPDAVKDPTKQYGEVHGEYDDEAVRDDKSTKIPPGQPDPFTVTK